MVQILHTKTMPRNAKIYYISVLHNGHGAYQGDDKKYTAPYIVHMMTLFSCLRHLIFVGVVQLHKLTILCSC